MAGKATLGRSLEVGAGACLTSTHAIGQPADSFARQNAAMDTGLRILLVEDDPALAREILRGLRADGWTVDHVACLAHAFEALLQAPYRSILLDRRLPDGDGLQLVAVARTRPLPPSVIFLTARDEIVDRIQGLDAGADDYLVKPFAMGELLARLRATCRRTAPTAAPPPIEVGNLAFEPSSREVRIDGAPLVLARRELALLELLLRRAGRVVQREHLDSEIYGFAAEVSANALESQVSRLRRRLHGAGARVEISTIRGLGYLLRAC